MKTIKIPFFLFVICGTTLTQPSCKSSVSEPKLEELSKQEILRKLCASNWRKSEVTLDGYKITTPFANMTITFYDNNTFSSSNSILPLWPASGSFMLVKDSDGDFTRIIRNDSVEINILELSENELTMRFEFEGTTSQLKEINGLYEFSMIKI